MYKTVMLAVLLVVAGTVARAESVMVEGSVQGLLCAMHGERCPVGEEYLIAGVEETFVLVDRAGEWWFLVPLKPAQLAVYLNRRFKVKGEVGKDRRVIRVVTAQVWRNGSWQTVYSPRIAAEMQRRRDLLEKVPDEVMRHKM